MKNVMFLLVAGFSLIFAADQTKEMVATKGEENKIFFESGSKYIVIEEEKVVLGEKLSMTVSVYDSTGTPIEDADLKMEPWMPSMGHGSAKTKVKNLGKGKYLIKRVYYSMAGDWELRFTIGEDKVYTARVVK